ncbi:TatD family hydrolase [Patescibacteria group bacterium]|nr:TatD family hydrolase [Patescibacteria group bacterium]
MLIDTHCHLSFKAYNRDWKDVVKRARDAGVQMITVGAARDTSEKAVTIAKEADGVFASIGCHPTHAQDEEFDFDWYMSQADNPKVVAIGECGVDYFHIDPESSDGASETRREEILKAQEELFFKHLKIAKEKDLPVILHTRDSNHGPSGVAYEHLYGLVKDFGYTRCVVHCFGGSWKWAEKFLDLGLMISFTGIVSFKNASPELRDVVRNTPKDKFMIETDAPYLAPEPYRGKQNEPAYVEYVAKAIAQIRGVSYDDIASETTKNAKKFFNI